MSDSGDREAKAAPEPLVLTSRTALNLKEAAKSVGISPEHLRNLLPEIPHLYLGRRLVIPVKPFEEWLREQAEVTKAESERLAEEILPVFGLFTQQALGDGQGHRRTALTQ